MNINEKSPLLDPSGGSGGRSPPSETRGGSGGGRSPPSETRGLWGGRAPRVNPPTPPYQAHRSTPAGGRASGLPQINENQ